MLRIIIHTDRDLTPPGKRAARIIRLRRGGRAIRWYVSGRIYATRPMSDLSVTRQWLDAEHCHATSAPLS